MNYVFFLTSTKTKMSQEEAQQPVSNTVSQQEFVTSPIQEPSIAQQDGIQTWKSSFHKLLAQRNKAEMEPFQPIFSARTYYMQWTILFTCYLSHIRHQF